MISVAQSFEFTNSRNDLQDVMAITHDLLASFVSKKYGTEAASCLAFSWVFQNEILMDRMRMKPWDREKDKRLEKRLQCYQSLNLRFLCPAVVYSV